MIENGGNPVDQGTAGEGASFKQELYKILGDKRISHEEALAMAQKFDLEKEDTIQYTFRQIAPLKEAMGDAFVGTDTRVDKNVLREYLQALAKEVKKVPCEPTERPIQEQPTPLPEVQVEVQAREESEPHHIPKPKDVETVKEKSDAEKIRALQKYFHFKDSEVQHIIETINAYTSTTGLEKDSLSIIPFLEGYKNYLETSLQGLDSKMKENIKQAIGRKTIHVSDIIEDRMKFVDQQILEKDYLESARIRELGNERWNIDHALSQSFDFINHQVLPSATLYIKYQDGKGGFNIPQDEKDTELHMKLLTTKTMLNAPVSETGDFDRTMSDTLVDGKIWQAYSEHWDIFDDREDGKHWVGKEGINQTELFKNTPKIDTPSLLNEQDKKIDMKAMKYFMAAIAIQIAVEVGPAAVGGTIGGVLGGLVGGGVDLIDLTSDTETLLIILQQNGLVPEEYRMSKTLWDNILAGVGLIPQATALIKGKKLAQLTAKYGDYKDELVNLFQLASKSEGAKILNTSTRVEHFVKGVRYVVDTGGNTTQVFRELNGKLHPIQDLTQIPVSTRNALGLGDAIRVEQKGTKRIDSTLKLTRESYAYEIEALKKIMTANELKFLEEAGLYLGNKINVNGYEYFASSRFVSKGTSYIITFVNTGEKAEPRIFRLGNHGTTWQSVAGFHGKDYAPSSAEFSGIDQMTGTNVEANLASLLNEIPISRQIVPNIGETYGKHLGFYSDAEHRFEVTPIQHQFQVENIPTIAGKAGRRQSLAQLDRDATIGNVLKRIRNIDMTSFNLTHFQRIGTEVETRSDLHFGTVELQRYETLYEGKKVEVTYGSSAQEPDLLWVEEIRFIGGEVNSYGLPAYPISGGLLTTNPLQKLSRMPQGIRESGAPVIQDGGIEYIDVRRFLQNNPLIRKLKTV